ncbi:hypothetical protein NPIL_666671 [Nephila pilipes]|uniref:Uncharacterized protein n=1 Tax=Nephila pilipes TaxID=299642 RepID=A0A8X6N5V2_NEPPI|nr:hypothetical protein NPIL_666671 [Nephila pilipes]
MDLDRIPVTKSGAKDHMKITVEQRIFCFQQHLSISKRLKSPLDDPMASNGSTHTTSVLKPRDLGKVSHFYLRPIAYGTTRQSLKSRHFLASNSLKITLRL